MKAADNDDCSKDPDCVLSLPIKYQRQRSNSNRQRIALYH